MKLLRILFHALGATFSLVLTGTFALLITVLVGLLQWAQWDGSLAQALRMVTSVLPAGQSLQASEVSGSLQAGGRIGQLRWTNGAIVLEAQGLELSWDWHGLLDGELRINALHARTLRMEDSRPPSNTPIDEFSLPLHADVSFVLDQLDWAGPPALRVQGLRGRYRFDGATHFLQDSSMRIAAASYRISGQMQAREPMAINLRASGTLEVPLKIRQEVLTLQAEASAQGTLFGSDAVLNVAADLQPQGSTRSRPLGSMQAHVQAQLKPAQLQPIASARGQWSALDLASLWPQAPTTSLSGQAQVLPNGGGWNAEIQVQNGKAGPLDQQRLPLSSANASLRYHDGQWGVSSLQAALAGGTVQAQGTFAGTPAQWSVSGTLQGIEPRQVDTRWLGTVLDGQMSAHQTATGIAFDTRLSGPLRLHSTQQDTRLAATGNWSAPDLQLDTLLLQTPDAQVSGQMRLDTRSYAATARLQATLPGAQVRLDGSVGPAVGQGSVDLQVSDASALAQWLRKLPVLGPTMPAADLVGGADLSARWSGGWQNSGSDLQLQASAKSKRLEAQSGFPLQDFQLDATGTLSAMAFQLHCKTQVGALQLALQAQAHVGQVQAGQWHGMLETLNLDTIERLQAVPWHLELQQRVAFDWQQSALNRSLTLAAGDVRLTGAAPGTPHIQWQAQHWTQQFAAGAPTTARWKSEGSLQGVPLSWLELLGQTQLSNLGLRGDLVFGGQWDASGGDKLRVRAGLQRTSGDVHLLAADQSGGSLPAGLRDARIEVQLNNDALHATLLWASDAGGNAQAEFNTRLQHIAGAPAWAADAPLQATLHANLPRVGAWSLFAPVGWRIHGTMEADAVLAGTRNHPDWQGSVEARDLTVRSVVDGIDFSNGVLRLRVNGQHMDITELTLQGAGGAAGGQLLATGSVDWLPAVPGGSVTSRLRMALDAKAQALRVTARPDQRLVVSGNLAARLFDSRLVLRGVLFADQALFVLPEDTAPKLGADVVVSRAKPRPGKAQQVATIPAPRLAQIITPDINIVLNPGSNFQVQGQGLNTRLAGLVTLQAEGRQAPPQLTGELRTVQGTYRAYGQRLKIEEGTLRFNGAYDNPALDIRAVRPNLPQPVGVQVSGTAQLPVVRLYSDPELSEVEKLSWLVLGRSSANGGAETAMLQQAALALLAGNGVSRAQSLVNAFGLDEVSLGRVATTNLDGSAGTEASVKLGKRISQDFYLAYERSLAGALGTFFVFYDLSKRFTLRGESGEQNAVDLIFTTRYD